MYLVLSAKASVCSFVFKLCFKAQKLDHKLHGCPITGLLIMHANFYCWNIILVWCLDPYYMLLEPCHLFLSL
jgi:hypothetical protein